MVPMWYLYPSEKDLEMLRRDLELYRYLLSGGSSRPLELRFPPRYQGR